VREAALGIDLGTSQLKALVRAPDGTVLGRGRAGYPVAASAGGHAESDPEAWWRAARSAIRDALASVPGSGIGAVGVTGQMHGAVLTRADGAPARPAVLWLDRRATAEALTYGRLSGELTRPLGNAPVPGMAGPVLRWLAAHESGTVTAARWALQPKDWLRFRLTGQAATDPTDASGTLLFDTAAGTWATDLIRALGLPERLLPEIRDPAAAAPLLPGAAEHLGLRPGIPVAVGASDTAAALFAARLPGGPDRLPEDTVLLTLGTGGQWVAPGAARPAVPKLNFFRAVDGTSYHLAPALNVGSALRWVTETLGASYDDLYATAARPARDDTPVFRPYLVPERSDEAAADSADAPGPAGATWTGMRLAHTRDDLLRGALEGVANLLRDRLQDLRAAGHDPRRVIIGGGGARHEGWRTLLSGTFGLPLDFAEDADWLSAVGAALLAERAAGQDPGRPTKRGRGELARHAHDRSRGENDNRQHGRGEAQGD